MNTHRAHSKRRKPKAGLFIAGLGIVIALYGLGAIRHESDGLRQLTTWFLEDQTQIQQGFVPYLAPVENKVDADLASAQMPSMENAPNSPPESSEISGHDPTDSIRSFERNIPEDEDDNQQVRTTSNAPQRLIIPTIDLDAQIIPVQSQELEVEGKIFQQWLAPDSQSVGWHFNSANIGSPGNTVLNGHHNIHGQVFRRLSELQISDRIQIQADGQIYEYVVGTILILPEKHQSLETRLSNAQWIQSSDDERVTLITCWPYDSNTHRVIVVAIPAIDLSEDPVETSFIGAF